MPEPKNPPGTTPRVALLGATRRSLAIFRRLEALAPGATRAVVSFREHGPEPCYFEDLRELAARSGARFIESKRLEDNSGADLADEPFDAAFLVNWRYRIATDRLCARRGVFVFHDSLLPAYRGFSPVVWAIANGERRTGATLFRLAEEIDAGPIVDQQEVSIGPDEAIGSLFERVTEAYLALLDRNFLPILAGDAAGRPQDLALATYARRRTPADDRIDWRCSTQAIYNLIRAVTHPYPGAYAFHSGSRLTVWAARPDRSGLAGEIRAPGRAVAARGSGVLVGTGDGSLLLETVQREGGVEGKATDVLQDLPVELR